MRLFAHAAIGAALIALSACAGGARPERIAATSVERFNPGDALHQALNVDQVQGGSETNPLWMSNISNEEFRAGLEASLRAAGLLATGPSTAQYRVVSSVQSLERPMAGFDMNVTMSVRYSVIPLAGGAPIFDEVVTSTGVGRMSEQFLGVERLRIAVEASARENITEFVRRLRVRAPGATITPTS
jgi:hypothetical protein